jgi:hypothetical protein
MTPAWAIGSQPYSPLSHSLPKKKNLKKQKNANSGIEYRASHVLSKHFAATSPFPGIIGVLS